ncbi:YIP1 family protein [Sulfitobacter sabulilitoris]|uniref:YIP1 family protein n=1 Tax=Sulfitobacter sabulilitoris TaxID=2562655 RepID=A0A5S3PJS4_9RHOB|nr:YIP1 family protein [Sulfitobacter sabulilitoris]TMM54597.1 YIP1 family protein [Sulfitobacter sabulilitoris]
MPVTQNITATYRGPGRVLRRLLDAGQREDRALAYLMAGCVVVFIAQLPRLAREAHLTGQELNMLLGATLMAWLFIAPLLLYLLAAITHVVARALRGQGSFYGARLALFWALLASSPLLLLHGLVAGFVGPGLELQIAGLAWLLVFGWFWISGLLAAERGAP